MGNQHKSRVGPGEANSSSYSYIICQNVMFTPELTIYAMYIETVAFFGFVARPVNLYIDNKVHTRNVSGEVREKRRKYRSEIFLL